MFKRITTFLLLVCFLLLLCAPLYSQESSVEPSAGPPIPEDPLHRGTPRGSITGFLLATSELNFVNAAEFLDLRNLPEEVSELGGEELARQLNQVLSRAVWLDDYTVSDSPDGAKGDDLPAYRDELVKITTRDGEISLLMQQVPRGDGVMIWKLSNRSVALIPELYDEFSYPDWIEKIRGWMPADSSFLGIEGFKWIILIGFVLLSWPLFYLLGFSLSRMFCAPGSENYPLVRGVMTGPVVALGILVVLDVVIQRLGAGAKAQTIMEAQTLRTLVVVWVLWSVINLYKHFKQTKMITAGRPGAAQLMNPITTFAKLVTVFGGLLFWLSNLGVNITTLLAGLGVGGLAIALALQKPLEDMMGALTLFSQAPIRVGDFCRYGEITGVVEEIGLRTTRLRTLTNTVVSIPNARIAYVEIENYSSRKKIRYSPELRLRYDTTPQQLQEILDNTLAMLQEHEQVHNDPLRVRFTDFESDAVLIKVNGYVDTKVFSEFLGVAEELNFNIMKIVHSTGASFALPGRSLYLEDKDTIPGSAE